MAHSIEAYNLFDENFNPFDAGGFGSSDGLGRDYDPPPNVDPFGNVIPPPGSPLPPPIANDYPDAGFSRRSPSRRDPVPAGGYGAYFDPRASGAGEDTFQGLMDLSGFSTIGDRTRQQLQADFNRGLLGFAQQEANIKSSGGGAISRINSQIAEKKKELANANKSYRVYMDTIAPGFADAVEKAEKAAMATAAIEATFDVAQGQVDDAYASASGRVRAIADKVAGSGAVEVANALNESIYEFKSFIDDQGKLNRDQTLLMHQAAAGLAAAAAESEHAGLQGTTAREQYVTQVKYEKIISDLLRQRAAAGAARRRALDQLKQARQDWVAGFNEEAANKWREIEGFQLEFLSANADQFSFLESQQALYFNQLQKDGYEITLDDKVASSLVITIMDANDWTFERFIQEAGDPNRVDENGVPEFSPDLVNAALRHQDIIEVGLHAYRDARDWHNEEISPLASTPFTQFMHNEALFEQLGLREGSAVAAAFEQFGPGFVPTFTFDDFNRQGAFDLAAAGYNINGIR